MTLNAIFDGKALLPEEPIRLEPNTRVHVTIKTIQKSEIKTHSFLQTARSLNLRGPSDWSDRFEDYLYEKGVNNNGCGFS